MTNWTSKKNAQQHYDKHVASSDSCWSDLLNKTVVNLSDYHKTACDVVNAPRYQYQARMKNNDGNFYPASVYSVGDQLIQSITDLTKLNLFTCYHMHKTSSHCSVMHRPPGEQIEELKQWIAKGERVGKIRDVVQLL
jgi:hypothetical protein